jgi:hypothetical protein
VTITDGARQSGLIGFRRDLVEPCEQEVITGAMRFGEGNFHLR